MLQDKTATTDNREGNDGRSCVVWEIWNRKDGLVYTMCDGYPDFLREPASPEVYTDRFWPWFVLTLNEVDHETMIFPPSDVKLIRDMQMDYNRGRQGIREHRRAARPKTVTAAGMIDQEDLEKLSNHPDNAIIELNGLQPGQKVDDLLQAFRGPPIDPNLYDVEQTFTDMMRVSGIQDANIGQTGGSPSATQSNIAEASRATAMGANIDDIDDLLTAFARAGAQILLQEVSVDTVKRIVGEGAVWPDMSRQQIADELWLQIEAGSTGRPNQAQEIANAERIFPMLMQLPGIKPEWLAKELIKRLDDKLDITTAFQSMLPSIIAMNGMASRLGAGPASARRPDGLPRRGPGSRPGGGFERAARASSRRAAPARPDRTPAASEPDARAAPYCGVGRPSRCVVSCFAIDTTGTGRHARGDTDVNGRPVDCRPSRRRSTTPPDSGARAERSQTTPDVTASPSEAEKSDTKETLLEAVLKAVKPADDAEERAALAGTSPPSESVPSSEPEAKTGEADKGPTSPKTLLPKSSRRTTNAPASASSSCLDSATAIKAEAEVTQTLRNFLVTNDIAREDFQLTLDLAAAMRRGDFKSFLEGVGPYVQLATQALGITLPPDLQSEVQQGRVTFDAAAQMSRDRYARALAEQRATRVTQVASTQQTAAQQQHLSRTIEQTVSAWENGIRQATRTTDARKKP